MRNFRFILTILLIWFSSTAFASFQKDLWIIWQANNPLNTAVINHDEWTKFLKNNVKLNKENIALINYKKISPEDVQLLAAYIKKLSAIPLDQYNRNEQLAFWINLYNAITVQIIIQYAPTSSIQDVNISPGLFSIGPWGKNLIVVNQKRLSLDEISNRIIRPIWNDPRTLYALNNGSIGAPNLFYEPFTGKDIENQLNQAASDYINSLRGVQLIENRLILSKIFEWYVDDFGGSDHIIQHLMIYAKNPLRGQLKTIHKIDRYSYNWHLNALTEP